MVLGTEDNRALSLDDVVAHVLLWIQAPGRNMQRYPNLGTVSYDSQSTVRWSHLPYLIRLESSPPDSSNPMGASLISLFVVAAISVSRRRSRSAGAVHSR